VVVATGFDEFSGGGGTGCVGEGVADVLFDEVGVDCDRGVVAQ
jgi:hypothetical protein